MPPKRNTKKSPGKRSTAVKKSPGKVPVARKPAATHKISPTKPTPPVASVTKSSPSSPSKYIKGKHVRASIPEPVPTDITNLVGKFLHSDIRQAAERLYDNVIPILTNPVLVDKKHFVNTMTDMFVDTIGPDFQTFLTNYRNQIKAKGVEEVDEIFHTIESIFVPTKKIKGENIWRDYGYNDYLEDFIHNFTFKTLQTMGQREGFFEGSMYDYFDSLVDEEENEDE